MSPKTRNIIGWVLSGLIAAFFLFGSSQAFMATPEMVAMGQKMGITPDTFKILGGLEILCTVLFLIPRTGVLGVLMYSAYLGGAIATHLEHQEPFTLAAIVLAVIWITALIRFPELGRRLFGPKMTL